MANTKIDDIFGTIYEEMTPGNHVFFESTGDEDRLYYNDHGVIIRSGSERYIPGDDGVIININNRELSGSIDKIMSGEEKLSDKYFTIVGLNACEIEEIKTLLHLDNYGKIML